MKIKAELTPHNSKLTTNSAQRKTYKLMEQTELGVVYGTDGAGYLRVGGHGSCEDLKGS